MSNFWVQLICLLRDLISVSWSIQLGQILSATFFAVCTFYCCCQFGKWKCSDRWLLWFWFCLKEKVSWTKSPPHPITHQQFLRHSRLQSWHLDHQTVKWSLLPLIYKHTLMTGQQIKCCRFVLLWAANWKCVCVSFDDNQQIWILTRFWFCATTKVEQNEFSLL